VAGEDLERRCDGIDETIARVQIVSGDVDRDLGKVGFGCR
jgi:hypothetical protein